MTDKETEDLQKYLGRMIAEQSRLQRALIDGEPLDDEAPPDLSGLLFPDPLRSTSARSGPLTRRAFESNCRLMTTSTRKFCVVSSA